MREPAVATLPLEPAQPGLGETLGRALDLAQRVAVDQVRLFQVESREHLQTGARRAAWIGAGLLCLVLAWIGALAAVVVALEGRFSLEARLALVAGSQAFLGLALVAWGLRRRSSA